MLTAIGLVVVMAIVVAVVHIEPVLRLPGLPARRRGRGATSLGCLPVTRKSLVA